MLLCAWPAKPAKDLILRPPEHVYVNTTLREAADHMVNHDVGRLPVLAKTPRFPLVGIYRNVMLAHKPA